MRKLLISIISILSLTAVAAFAQNPKGTDILFSYKMYPELKYDKNISTYHLEVNYENEFLCGTLDLNYDTVTKFTTYKFIPGNIINNVNINGLTKSESDGIRIVINYKSTGNADKVIADYDAKTNEMVNAENALVLVGKMKDKLVFADVFVYEGQDLLTSKHFEWKIEYKTDYIDFYNNKTGKDPYQSYDQNKMTFADKNAQALYLLGGSVYFTNSDISGFVNSKLGTFDKNYKMEIYTGKGKKMDFSQLDATKDKALEAVKNNNKAELQNCINTWLEHTKKADYDNDKAQYNKNIVASLYLNCLHACLVMEDFEQYKNISKEINTNKDKFKNTWVKDIDKVSEIINQIEKNRIKNAHRF